MDTTQAIEIDPKNAHAYDNRGFSHWRKGNYDLSIEDATKAIEIDPKLTHVYAFRAAAFESKADYDAAIADRVRSIEFDPKNSLHVRSLGLTKFLAGDFSGASSDLARAFELRGDIHVALFLYLARKQAGEANAKQLPIKVWPYALAEFYLGKRSAAQLPAAETTRNIRCQTQFYVGEWYVLNGNREEGRASLNAAVESCPKELFESNAAIAELKRLKP